MAFCEKMCDGCGLAAIEDPTEREAASQDVRAAINVLGRPVIRNLGALGPDALENKIEAVCQDTPETLEWQQRENYDPQAPIRQVNLPAVAASVLRIANNECPNQYLPTVLTS